MKVFNKREKGKEVNSVCKRHIMVLDTCISAGQWKSENIRRAGSEKWPAE